MKKFKLTTWVIVSVLIMITSCKKDEVVEPAPLPVMNLNYVRLSLDTWYSNSFKWKCRITTNGGNATMIIKTDKISSVFIDGAIKKEYINFLLNTNINIKVIGDNQIIFEKIDMY